MSLAYRILTATCFVLVGAIDGLAQDATQKAAKPEAAAAAGPLLIKPYLQLGYAHVQRQVDLVWHASDKDAGWTVDYRPGAGRGWQTASGATFQRVAVAGVEPQRVYHVALSALEPGQTFAYRLSEGGKAVFESEARARRPISPSGSWSSETAVRILRKSAPSPTARSCRSPTS